MGAVADLSDLVFRLTGGTGGEPEHEFVFKHDRVAAAAAVAPVAGRLKSLWLHDGIPGPGAAPGTTWTQPTRTTAGAMQITNPGGGLQKWLAAFGGVLTQPGTLLLLDRLSTVSGFDGTNTAAQTGTGTSDVTRYTGTEASGNMLFVEVYTQIGATSTTATCSYTDQDGNSGQTTPAFPIGNAGFRDVGQLIPVPLAAGDTGVRAVANIDLLATTGTAGNFGLTIARPLAVLVNHSAGLGAYKNMLASFPSAVEIKTDACLMLAYVPGNTTAPLVFADAHFVSA